MNIVTSNWYILAPIVLLGAYIVYNSKYRNRGMKKEVMLCRPEDNRFETLSVNRETEMGLYCKKHEGIEPRIYKTGPGWTSRIIRSLPVERSPLVSCLNESQRVTTTVSEFLKFKWGEGPYSKLPNELKAPLEEGTGITVTIKPILPEKSLGLDRIKGDAILAESDRANLDEFGKGTPRKEGMKDLTMDIAKILLGGFAMYFLLKQGIL